MKNLFFIFAVAALILGSCEKPDPDPVNQNPTPTTVTLPATAVTGTSVTVNGTVNPNTLSTDYHFEYGTSITYGSTTAVVSAGNGNTGIAVNANISGLIGGTTYHFRVVATFVSSGTGTKSTTATLYGSDQTFKTAGCDLPTDAGAITGSQSVFAGDVAVAYSVPQITGATTYVWDYSGTTGATINGTGNQISIGFSADATSGNLTVFGKNDCGNGAISAAFPIMVSQRIPPLPTREDTVCGSWQETAWYRLPVGETQWEKLQLADCKLDDTLKFLHTSRYEEHQGTNFCLPSSPELYGDGSWFLSQNGSSINIGGTNYEIEILNNNYLTFKCIAVGSGAWIRYEYKKY